tara:strand:+ start:63 stop:605 length:543 start_codon:yes stop_codon:yes gene_type:complete
MNQMKYISTIHAIAQVRSTWGALLASIRDKRREWKADYRNDTVAHVHQGIYLSTVSDEACDGKMESLRMNRSADGAGGNLPIIDDPSHEIGDFDLTKKSFESVLANIIMRIKLELPEFSGELIVNIEGNGYLYDSPSQLASGDFGGDLADYWDLQDVARITIPPVNGAGLDTRVTIEFSV